MKILPTHDCYEQYRDHQDTDDYFVGLDVGVASVGLAATDPRYHILTYNHMPLMTSRLFLEAQTAAERREHRNAKRSLWHAKDRRYWLQEIFEPAIQKIDPTFFMRLNQSNLYADDKQNVPTAYTLFCDDDFTDKDYYGPEHPTIYHWISELIHSKDYHDPRIVYLALYHMIEHRGHFNLWGQSFSDLTSFSVVYQAFADAVEEQYGSSMFQTDEVDKIGDILKNKHIKPSKKPDLLADILHLQASHKQEKAMLKLLIGLSVPLSTIFQNNYYKETDFATFKFNAPVFDEQYDDLADTLGNDMTLLTLAKAIYDWTVLSNILHDKTYLSDAYIASYQKHHNDLSLLKRTVRHYIPDKYKAIFYHTPELSAANPFNYAHYVGNNKRSDNNGRAHLPGTSGKKKKGAQIYQDFAKFVTKCFHGYETEEPVATILAELEAHTFLPLQRFSENTIIPYQVHEKELMAVLQNAVTYLPFLTEMDDTYQLTNADKIMQIFGFRNKFYVGPTTHNPANPNSIAWAVRVSPEPIRPWNYSTVIDEAASAVAFIERMTNECTYLRNENVLPKSSLLYQEYEVRSELNNLRYMGEPLAIDDINRIYETLCLVNKTVSKKQIVTLLSKYHPDFDADKLTGFSQGKNNIIAKCNMYQLFTNRLAFDLSNSDEYEMAEMIIYFKTVYPKTCPFANQNIHEQFGDRLNELQLSYLDSMQLQGWGRLSKELLSGITGYSVFSDSTETHTIIEWMRQVPCNLMQLLSQQYSFLETIETCNRNYQHVYNSTSYDEFIQSLPGSPAIKRSIRQSLHMMDELVHKMGHAPSKIFLEVARSNEFSKESKSRYDQVKELLIGVTKHKTYSKTPYATRAKQLLHELEALEEYELKSRRKYLYFTQLGYDMYTGEDLNWSSIKNNTGEYDLDHIIAKSKSHNDNSLHNNLVLTSHKFNSDIKKDDDFGEEKFHSYKRARQELWTCLKETHLINETKYNRVSRTTPLSVEELAGFVGRQLVETRQSTKLLAGLLKELYPDTKIVYVKAQLVSNFAQEFLQDVYRKNRDLNDLHHAKDAYLNVVVGNVYDAKFTQNPYNWFKKNYQTTKPMHISLHGLFTHPVGSANHLAWDVETLYEDITSANGRATKRFIPNGDLITVRDLVQQDLIQTSKRRYISKGPLFDQLPVPKGSGTWPLKKELANKERYGGYNTLNNACFFLVEHTKKGKRVRTIERICRIHLNQLQNNIPALEEYCMSELQYEDPVILQPNLLMNQKMLINGFPCYLTGQFGSNITVRSAIPFTLSMEHQHTFIAVQKYVQQNAAYQTKQKKTNSNMDTSDVNSMLPILPYHNVTEENTEALYRTILEKFQTHIYKHHRTRLGTVLAEKEDTFLALPLQKRCQVLWIVCQYMISMPKTGLDLRLLGLTSCACATIYPKDITKYNSFKFVNETALGFRS